MQKKFILPVAVLSLAMLATACTTNRSDQGYQGGQGMSPTGQGYTTGKTGYNNTTGFNRVTYRDNYGYNPMDRTGTSPLNRNTTMNRYSGNNWGTTGINRTGMTGTTGYNGMTGTRAPGYPYTGTGTTGLNGGAGFNGAGYNGAGYNGAGLGGMTLNDTRNNPSVFTPNVNGQADKIAQMVTGIKGVDSAKSLVAGNVAYIGLDISSKVSRRNAARIEQEAHRVVSRALPGYDVRITSDRGLFQRTGTFFNNDYNNYNGWNRTMNRTTNQIAP